MDVDQREVTEEVDDIVDEQATEPEVESSEAVEASDNEVDEQTQEGVIVSFGDEKPEDEGENHSDPQLPKKLRSLLKDEKKARKAAEREAAELKKSQQAKTDDIKPLRARPTLEAHNYDEDAFNADTDKWFGEKQEHDNKASSEKKKQEEQQEAWEARVGEYIKAKNSFKQDEFEESELAVKDALSDMQQNIILHAFGAGAANIIAGLGQDDDRLQELAKIKDHTLFTVALTRLESKMKVTPRRPKHSPETHVSGSASGEFGDRQLKTLEAEAEKTGDYTKVFAHKRRARKQ